MKNLKSLISLILVFSFVFIFAGCSRNDTTTDAPPALFDWGLYGKWVSIDGELGSSIQLSISGETPVMPEESLSVEVNMDIIWPENHTYLNLGSQPFVGYSGNDDGHTYYWFPTYFFNKNINRGEFSSITIYPAEEFVVFMIGNDRENFLIASTDPNADYVQLCQIFKTTLLANLA